MRMERTPKSGFALALAVTFGFLGAVQAHDWEMGSLTIPTRWAASVGPTNALPEYPRPQMERDEWQNLNGLWQYAITTKDAEAPERYDGSILVPYPLESALSGVQKSLQPDQLLWYRRTLTLKPGKEGNKTLLHFGAVDYEATVYLNDQEVGAHSGGYQAFTVDLSGALQSGDNKLVVRVYDPTNKGSNPRGKQVLRPGGIEYTSSSGIWQTVWLETVPQTYIENLKMTPDVDGSRLHLRVNVRGQKLGYTVQAIAKIGSEIVAKQTVEDIAALRIGNPRLWSPDDPFLYDLEVRLLRDGRIVDQVQSYFGLRKIEVRRDAAGIERIFLNGQYTYNLGVLDQGFWPDGLYTAPTDEALKFDIQAAKAMGFNTIRKHVKIEPDRWYYHCDKLGMLVWQDMVPPGARTPQARAQFEKETQANLAQLHNHPSITTWVLFNEGWGAYEQERLERWMKALDSSRLLNGLSGRFDEVQASRWFRSLSPEEIAGVMAGDPASLEEMQALQEASEGDGPASDMTDLHHYPDPRMPPEEAGKARVLGEFGGIGVSIEDHLWDEFIAGWGYRVVAREKFVNTYTNLMDQLKHLERQGLSGSIYTQSYDVEGEQNGLMAYDRAVIKIPVSEILKSHGTLIRKSSNYAAATQGFSIVDADVIPEARRYAELLAEYDRGRRDLPFLKRFSLMALRQKDQPSATRAGDEFIERAARPYSRDTWAFIVAVTRTSKDKGFELLRTQGQEANAALGENTTEKKILEVIGREEIDLRLVDKAHPPDWSAIEKSVSSKYGMLGAEKAYGAQMLHYLQKQDWPRFGRYFTLYFSTALSRSEYPIHNLAYQVLQHVGDPKALATAIKAVESGMKITESSNPVELDTYAGLLYKAGHHRDAVIWQEKAVNLNAGTDHEMASKLQKMKTRKHNQVRSREL